MLLCLKEAFGYRPILIVDDPANVTTSENNTTYVLGFPGEDQGFVNSPMWVFYTLMNPLIGQTVAWAQMQFQAIDPNEAFQMAQMGKLVFPFILYKSAMLTLLSIKVIATQSLVIRLEFQENPIPFFNAGDPV